MSSEDRIVRFDLLSESDREVAYEELDGEGKDRCFQFLPERLRGRNWHNLTPLGKVLNYIYLSQEQRTHLSGISSTEVDVGIEQFNQLSVEQQNEFWLRVAESVYSE